jgi:hypothetical protein
MQRMVLGRTGLEMYRVGFGGIPIQRVSEEQAVATVAHAVRAGVDFIDTSRMYTTSERRIGLALQQTDGNVILATKSTQRTAAGILADIEVSRRELQCDSIDLYQCHFVNDGPTYEQVVGPGGAIEGLRQAKQAGLIGHYGLTSHSLDLLDRTLKDGLFETIMVCYGILEPLAATTIIPTAIVRNVGVIAMKSFSGGVIDRADLAIRFGLEQPQLLLIPGVETPALFDESWREFQADPPLTAAHRAEIAALQQQHDRSFCRRCDYCLPCPQGIYIQTVLGARQLVQKTGLATLRPSALGRNIAHGHGCTGCQECVARCPYQLPIPELIKENLAWYDAQA